MLKFDDPRWEALEGGYGIPYDPRPALARLERDSDLGPVWAELWENLHHEGEVGEASYASVPHIVRIARSRAMQDWNVFALVGTIGLEKGMSGNPGLPTWLVDSYEDAWEQLFELARGGLADAGDTLTLRCLLATIAIAKGDPRRGRLLLDFDDDELDEILAEDQDEDEASF